MDKIRVLVVDDEPLIRSLLEKYFKTDPRFEFELKSDGAFIMDEHFEINYDLMIFDILMPKVNGIELLQNVLAKKPGIKTLGITGMANDGLLRQINELGCSVVLKKPIKRKEFLEAIYSVLNIPAAPDKP